MGLTVSVNMNFDNETSVFEGTAQLTTICHVPADPHFQVQGGKIHHKNGAGPHLDATLLSVKIYPTHRIPYVDCRSGKYFKSYQKTYQKNTIKKNTCSSGFYQKSG